LTNEKTEIIQIDQWESRNWFNCPMWIQTFDFDDQWDNR